MFDRLLDNGRHSIRTYVVSFQALIAVGIGLLLGISMTRTGFDRWLEIRSAESYIGHEDGEKFEFCYYCVGPSLIERFENVFDAMVQILSLPAVLVSEVLVRFYSNVTVGVESYALWQLYEFSIIHLNIATYLLLGYLVHKKT